jgi:ribosome-associated protein
MDAMSQTKGEFFAIELGKLLDDHRGIDVVAMDMRPLNFWTDFFVIATVTSDTHLLGLERHIKDYVRENGLEIIHRSRKLKAGAERNSSDRRSTDHRSTDHRSTDHRSDEWSLLDLGNIVIHLMSAKTRQFFELERLWSAAPFIFQTDGLQISGSIAHSSKSS